MKKIFKLLLSCLLVTSLVACGSDNKQNSSNTDQTVITFWGHQNEPWNASYNKIAKAFEESNPEYKIKFEFFPYDQFESKVQTSLMTKEGGADIYELWGGWAVDFTSTGALAPVPETFANTIRNDVYKPTIGSLEYDGKLYGLPMEFNIESGAMLVNLNLLNANNLKVPTTWNELIETSKKVVKKSGDFYEVKGFDFVNWDSVPYIYLSMILSQDGKYLNSDGSFNFTSTESLKAFEELTNLVLRDGLTDLEGLNGGSGLEGYQQLFAGTNFIVPRGPWVISEGVSSFELEYDKDFTYVSMPWFSDKVAFAAETGWSMAVNGNSKVQEGAFKFMEYFFKDENLLAHNIACTQIPPKISVAQNPALLKDMPYAKVLVSILDKAEYIGYFNTDQFKEIINNVFTEYVSGDIKTINEATLRIENELNSKLNN